MTTLTYYLVRSTLFLLVCPSPFVIIHSVNLKYSLLFLSSSRHLFRTESRYRFMFHQRCIQNPVKHLRWSVLNKSLNINLLFFETKENENHVNESWHTHAQEQYVRLHDVKNPHISLVPHEKPCKKYYFSSKNMAPGLVSMLLALNVDTTKTYFLCYYIWIKTLYNTLFMLLHWNVSTQLCIITQPSFQ